MVPVAPPSPPRHSYLFLISDTNPPPPSNPASLHPAKQPLLSPITCGAPRPSAVSDSQIELRLPAFKFIVMVIRTADMRQNIFTSYGGKYFYDNRAPPTSKSDSLQFKTSRDCPSNFRFYSEFLSVTTMR